MTKKKTVFDATKSKMLMFHDDDCGEFLDGKGMCPKCKFHPDMQSTGFKSMHLPELERLKKLGHSFLGKHREVF